LTKADIAAGFATMHRILLVPLASQSAQNHMEIVRAFLVAPSVEHPGATYVYPIVAAQDS
jgi:hypothetical protein